jgi:light-regulated signal transduction histidine kinase (bacteriophytochrome)
MLNLINTIPLPTFVATADDVIVHANELGLKFFNTNLDSLKNQPIAVVFSDISKDHIQAAQLSENGVLYHIYYIMGNTKVSELEELVYSVSHDLQEPLNAISGYSNLLKEEYQTKLDAEGNLFVDFLSKSAERMQGLVKSLLNFSKPITKDTFGAADLNQVLQEAQEDLAFAIKESGAKIHFEKLPTVFGSSMYLRLLFQNLIGNAIKFRSKEEQSIIEISAEERNSDWLIQIKDNGIGIPSENLDSIFFLFKKVGYNQKFEGNGIGLAHCKKIVEMHGGTIWAESELGKGTIIYFTISKNK